MVYDDGHHKTLNLCLIPENFVGKWKRKTIEGKIKKEKK